MRIGKLNWLGFLIIAFILLLAVNYHSINRNKLRWKLPAGTGRPAISLGASHGLIIAPDGSLWSWGSDFLGWPVLGSASGTNQTTLHRIGHETHWASISAGTSHNLAVTVYGTLWAWGQNVHRQLGDGTIEPTQDHPVPSAVGNDWQQAAAGGSFSIALKKNGTLWAWGNNWAGQLGIGSTNDSVAPAQVGSATNWVKIWAGSLNGIGLQSDGSLWIWGDNPALSNQLARSTKNLLAPTRVSPDTNWVAAAFGSQVFLALKSDGTLWAWGRYAANYTGGPNQPLIPNRVGANSDWQSISSAPWARDLYVVLRKRDGSLWAMEYSAATRGAIRLTRIPLQKDLVAVAGGGGGEHGADMMHDGIGTGVALTRDGEVWAWGQALGYTPAFSGLQSFATVARKFHLNAHWGDPHPITHPIPELLPVVEQGN